MKDYRALPAVGYWPGVEMKKVVYGDVNYALVVAGALTDTPTSHKLKIYSNNNYEFFIKLNGKQLRFSDCKWLFKTIYSK